MLRSRVTVAEVFSTVSRGFDPMRNIGCSGGITGNWECRYQHRCPRTQVLRLANQEQYKEAGAGIAGKIVASICKDLDAIRGRLEGPSSATIADSFRSSRCIFRASLTGGI